MTQDAAFAAARALYKARKYAEAELQLAQIGPGHPDHGGALRLLAKSAADRLDWRAAEDAANRSIALNGETTEDLWILALAHRNHRNFAEAVPLFRRLVTESSTDKQVRRAYGSLAYCLTSAQQAPEAEAVLREAIARYPLEASYVTELAENLASQGRSDEAQEAARAALALDEGQTKARSLLSIAGHTAPPPERKHRLAIWPKKSEAFRDARDVIVKSLLRGYPAGDRFITPSTKFLTLGSCFATNLAVRLRQNGLEVFSEFIGEEVNSTYANRYFLDWVENGVGSEPTRLMEEAYGPELRLRYLEAIKTCDVFVFTLGVAPCFFRADTGAFYFTHATAASHSFLLDNFVMRTTTVDENVANVVAIIETIRRLSHGQPNVVLTVSPVPLAATAEMQSAVIADCLSKSTLRLACEQVRAADRGGLIHYWPSFEIVRWLGPYFGHMHPPVFGDMDGKTRHVSNWLVDLIMDLFLETYSAADAGAVASQAAG